MHRNEENVTTKLQRIAAKASKDKHCQFSSLFHLMNKSLLLECFTALKGKAASGIDKITKEQYANDLEANLEKLVKRLHQALYPQQSEQKPGLGFPIAWMVAIICLSTGVILNAAMGQYKGKGGSEQGLFRELIDSLESGDILLADRYYTGYFLVAMLMNKGVDIIFQQHATRKTDFRKGQQLGTRAHIVYWKKPKKRPDWMNQEQYELFPNELGVREFKANNKVLVTTLLSVKHAPKKELASLNKQRWHIELDLRNIKTTLGMETLSCKTPAMNEKEMWVYFLAYNLIRLVMAQAALHSQLMPRQLSFKHTVQIWLMWSKQFSPDDEHAATLLMMIAQIRVGNRPGRIEPRAVKRRPKHYSLLMKPRDEARDNIKKNGHPKKR